MLQNIVNNVELDLLNVELEGIQWDTSIQLVRRIVICIKTFKPSKIDKLGKDVKGVDTDA